MTDRVSFVTLITSILSPAVSLVSASLVILKRHHSQPFFVASGNSNPNLSLQAIMIQRIFPNLILMTTLLVICSLFTSVKAAEGARVGQRILMIEMTPALCSIYPSRGRMRQCLEGYSLTVSGLDLGYGDSCGRGGIPDLTPLQLRVVNRVMPDATVRNQAWRRYGACSPLSSNLYFRQIVTHASELKLPPELNTGNSYTVSKARFQSQILRLNAGMRADGIDLICQNTSRNRDVLTEIHVCYQGSAFGKCPSRVDNCGSNFIISGGR